MTATSTPHPPSSAPPSPPASTPTPELDGMALLVVCSRFSRTAARLSTDNAGSVTWRILAILDAAGPLRPSEVARRERTSRPAATDALRRLAREGLVVGRDDPEDARARLVELTDQGRAHLQTWRGQVADGMGSLLADLSPEDRATLSRATDLLHHLTDTTEGLLEHR